MRAQSPSNAHQYHYSPTRHHLNLLSDDRKTEDKKADPSKAQTTTRKSININGTNPTSQTERNVLNTRSHLKGDTTEKNHSPDRKANVFSKVDSSETKVNDRDKKKGGLSADEVLINLAHHSVLTRLYSSDTGLSVCDRIGTMHVNRKSGSWHHK